MKDVLTEAEVYSIAVKQEVPECNRKTVYNAYIDGFNNAIDVELIDTIIDYYKDYCAGVENGEIDEYEISSVLYIMDKIKAHR